MLTEFELPAELQSANFATFRDQMLARLPKNIDVTEGSFAFDMMAPPALLAAELTEFYLAFGLKCAFHMWATGDWLDLHAHDCGLSRREATHAYGNIQVTADPFLTFPQGFIFSVPSENGATALDFELVDEGTVDETGHFEGRIRAVLSGLTGNVRADSITIMKNPVDNVYIITNTKTSGGVEVESDDSLRKRIDDFYAGRGSSFVGNKRDYIRWAKSVAGVGYAHVIPLYAGENSVKLVIADMNGEPANEEILNAVATFIFGTGHDDINRLAPIGVAKWAVVAPKIKPVNYSLHVKLAKNYASETVTENIRTKLDNFYLTLADDENHFHELRYVKVSEQILNTDGVADFKHLRINGGLENIEFDAESIPATGTIELMTYDKNHT